MSVKHNKLAPRPSTYCGLNLRYFFHASIVLNSVGPAAPPSPGAESLALSFEYHNTAVAVPHKDNNGGPILGKVHGSTKYHQAEAVVTLSVASADPAKRSGGQMISLCFGVIP